MTGQPFNDEPTFTITTIIVPSHVVWPGQREALDAAPFRLTYDSRRWYQDTLLGASAVMSRGDVVARRYWRMAKKEWQGQVRMTVLMVSEGERTVKEILG